MLKTMSAIVSARAVATATIDLSRTLYLTSAICNLSLKCRISENILTVKLLYYE